MTFSTLNYMKNKIQEKGLLYCIKTGVRIYPSILINYFVSQIDRFNRFTRPARKRFWMRCVSKKYSAKKNFDALYAFYDLDVSPPTFDIIVFLVLAEHTRIQKKCKYLHVLITPGRDNGFRPRDLKIYQELSIVLKNASNNYMEWRLRNIVLPSCWLIPSCKGVTVFTTRDEALAFELSFVEHCYPEDFSTRFPISSMRFNSIMLLTKQGITIPSIAVPPQALIFIKEWLKMNIGTRRAIVITFRESTYQLERNSNLNEWSKFIQNLDTSEFCAIIVRDTETAFERLPHGFAKAIQFPEVCFNIELRAALYESCYLNLVVAGGTDILCQLNKNVQYIIFKWTHSGLGVEPGTSPGFWGPFQKYVWEDDTFEVIQREFKEMVEKIENNQKNR